MAFLTFASVPHLFDQTPMDIQFKAINILLSGRNVRPFIDVVALAFGL